MKKYIIFLYLFIIAAYVSCDGTLLEETPAEKANVITISEIATDVTADSATLFWITNIPASHQVEYGTASGAYTEITEESGSETTSHTVTITGLSTNVIYYFRALNYSADAADAFSAESTFTTSSTIEVSSLTATATSDTEATISWTTNIATTHFVEYGIATGDYSYSTVESDLPTTSHTVNLTGLTPDSQYFYRVRNFHSTYEDIISAEDSFTTDAETHPNLEEKLRGIWIVGGLSGNGTGTVVSQIDLYDPVNDTWYPNAASLTNGVGYTPVCFAAVASVNSKIYVIGGYNSSGTVLYLNQEYDIATDTWTSKSVASFTPCANTYGVVLDNRIYILGGTTTNAIVGVSHADTSLTQCYNVSANSWISCLAFGTAGSERFAVGYNGIVYNMGGRTSATACVDTHNGYISVQNANTSTDEAVLTSARTGISGAIYRYPDGAITIFLVGGATALTGCTGNYVFQGTSTYTTLNSPYRFQYTNNPFSAAWTSVANNTPGIAFGSAVISGTNLYYFGGCTGLPSVPGAVSVNTYSIDISSKGSYGSWSNEVNMPVGRYGHASVIINQ